MSFVVDIIVLVATVSLVLVLRRHGPLANRVRRPRDPLGHVSGPADETFHVDVGREVWRTTLANLLHAVEVWELEVVEQKTHGRILTVEIAITVRGPEESRAGLASYIASITGAVADAPDAG